MVIKRFGRRLAIVLLLGVLISGCQFDPGRLTRSAGEGDEKLIRVEIVFTDDQTLIGYVKGLSIAPESKIYVGGSSTNYLYDAEGNIVGAYNYQRVLYMKILPAENKQ